jgi:hypothetical protein
MQPVSSPAGFTQREEDDRTTHWRFFSTIASQKEAAEVETIDRNRIPRRSFHAASDRVVRPYVETNVAFVEDQNE